MPSKWDTLILKCFQQRISPAKFQSYVRLLRKDDTIGGTKLCSLILKRVCLNDGGVDPLVINYLESLLAAPLLQPQDVLQALLDWRGSKQASEDHDAFTDTSIRLTLESTLDQSLLIHLARGFSTHEFRPEGTDYGKMLAALAAWMNSLVAQSEDVMISTAAASSQEITQAVLISRESFATMLITYLANSHVVEHLKTDHANDEAKLMAEAFMPYMPMMAQTNVQLAGRLQMIQREVASLQISDSAKVRHAEDGNEDIGQMRLQSIMDAEPANTRASFLIHLDGLLEGRPNASESQLLGYVQTRYKGDASTAIVDFVTACFDILAVSLSRGDSDERTFTQRSFLTNKAPSIILLLASTGFISMSSEVLISQAFSRFDQALFSQFPQNTLLSVQNNLIFEARQQFLTACVLNNVLAPDSVVRITGEQSAMTLPPEGRLNRQPLFQDGRSSPQKLDQLIEKTQAFDGNAATRVEALTQIFQSTCESRDKAALKTLCNQISRRTHSMDAIALYTDIRTFLQPLCFLLTEWKHEDDEGEYQPIYDEFSACLLLLVAMAYRFKLSPTELGFPTESTFWQLLLQANIAAMPINTLSEIQNRRLSGWIGGLFESNSIGDEVLSSCPPQEFYLLAPTIFQQTIMACRLGALEATHLKNGLELLLESFLMPAIVPTFLWLINNAQEHADEDNIFISILSKIIHPGSLNGDASGMHTTVLSILGDPLISFLNDLKRRQPGRTTIDSLIVDLQKHSGFTKAGEATNNSIQSWIDNSPDGIIGTLRANIGALCYWTSNGAMQTPVPSFTHQMVKAAVELKGAKAALLGIVEEINGQIATGLGDAALDIGTAIILSSSIAEAASQPNHITLRDALQLELADAARVFADKDGDHLRAEACVRLSRRVETLLANIAAASSEHEHQQAMQMPMADAMMGDIGLDAATAAAVGLGADDAVAQEPGHSLANTLDFAGTGTGDLQLNIDAALAGQPQQQQQRQDVNDQDQSMDGQLPSAEDDIFGDLVFDDYNF